MTNTNCATSCETKQAIRPRVDIRETDTGITVEAELPGVAKENTVVEVRDGKLMIEGSRATSTSESRWHLRERPDVDFYRAFEIGDTIDTSDIRAKMENGVLVVELSKKEELAPKSIAIQ